MYKSLLSILEKENSIINKINCLMTGKSACERQLEIKCDDFDDYEAQRCKYFRNYLESLNKQIESAEAELAEVRNEMREWFAELKS